jgi:hypothetical protein
MPFHASTASICGANARTGVLANPSENACFIEAAGNGFFTKTALGRMAAFTKTALGQMAVSR